MKELQVQLLTETVRKNIWCGNQASIRFDVWSNYAASSDVLRTYLCNDGSGYVRGFYDGDGTFYVKRYHLRDEEWMEEENHHA